MSTRARATRILALCCAVLLGVVAVVPAQQDAETRFVDAESAFAAGEAETAIRLLDQLIEDTPRGRYPDSPWRAAAAVRAGEIELALGRAQQASTRFVGVIDGEETGSWTSRARFGLATAMLWNRDWQAAAPLLQQVIDAFHDDDVTAEPMSGTLAAERLTLLHRMWLRAAAGGQPWQRTARFELGAELDRPIGVSAGQNGVLVSDESADAVIFRDSGGNAATFAVADPQRPWWSELGEAYIAARSTVAAPLSGAALEFTYRDGDRQRTVEDVRAGLRTPAGEWLLLDDDTRRVLRFAPDRTYLGTLDLRGGQPLDVERGPRGRFFVLERSRREVVTFAADGTLQGGFAVEDWRAPYALAVDAIGNVYVLDRDNKRIDVFDPDGGILWTIGPVLPGGVELDDPRDIAVDGSGRILVADRGLRVVVVIE